MAERIVQSLDGSVLRVGAGGAAVELGDVARLRDLLLRTRNVLLLEYRRQAFDHEPEPSPLMLEIDAALGIEDHGRYAE